MLKTVKNTNGFTLIEMMVAVSIFAIVAVIVAGAIVTTQRVNQKARAVKLVMDNLNFVLDSMVLKLSVGGPYECQSNRFGTPPIGEPKAKGCGSGGEAIFFGSGFGQTKKFLYQLSANKKAIEYWETDFNNFVVITRSDLELKNDELFYVFNLTSTPSSHWPRVLVTLYGETNIGGSPTRFGVETSVSQRY